MMLNNTEAQQQSFAQHKIVVYPGLAQALLCDKLIMR